jgi:hypothetical protein
MELGENLISNRSVRPTDGGLPWYSASGGGADKDQPLAGDKDATAARDGSLAATVKVLGDVAERY